MTKPSIILLCQVIDNFGDAGFALRLSRALIDHGYHIDLFHDNHIAFEQLIGQTPIDNLTLRQFHEALTLDIPTPKAIFQPFGTSALGPDADKAVEHLEHAYRNVPWVVIDYLSAEGWIEAFHNKTSISPNNGHKKIFFYPGFTHRTGGIISADFARNSLSLEPKEREKFCSIFCFHYPQAPIKELINALAPGQKVYSPSATSDRIVKLAFVPQAEFDELLLKHDFLFVRGEDSFVRAQLSGRPFAWQIYPTDDAAHIPKLTTFFNLYTVGLDGSSKSALWKLWACWNGLSTTSDLKEAWDGVNAHALPLSQHAESWSAHLLNGPELTTELLRVIR